jgi:hypothetical protein
VGTAPAHPFSALSSFLQLVAVFATTVGCRLVVDGGASSGDELLAESQVLVDHGDAERL